jgi:hypothetical protein
MHRDVSWGFKVVEVEWCGLANTFGAISLLILIGVIV